MSERQPRSASTPGRAGRRSPSSQRPARREGPQQCPSGSSEWSARASARMRVSGRQGEAHLDHRLALRVDLPRQRLRRADRQASAQERRRHLIERVHVVVVHHDREPRQVACGEVQCVARTTDCAPHTRPRARLDLRPCRRGALARGHRWSTVRLIAAVASTTGAVSLRSRCTSAQHGIDVERAEHHASDNVQEIDGAPAHAFGSRSDTRVDAFDGRARLRGCARPGRGATFTGRMSPLPATETHPW